MGDGLEYKVRVRLQRLVREALFLRQNASGRSLSAELNHVLRQALTADIARVKKNEEKAGETLCTPQK